MRKRAIRIGLSLVGLIVLLLILLETSFFQQWVLRRVQNVVSTAGYSLTADRLALRLWDLQGTLYNVTFDDRQGTRITADRLTVDAPWNAWNAAIITINSVDAEGVTIDIRSPEPVIPEPSGDRTEAPRIRFGRISIRNAKLSYSNQSTKIDIPAFGIEANQGRGAIKIDAPITITPDIVVRIPDIPILMSDAGINIDETRWRIEHPEVTVAGKSQGAFQWAPAIGLRLNYTTDPVTYDNWRDIQSSGQIGFDNGVLKLTDFRATRGGRPDHGRRRDLG